MLVTAASVSGNAGLIRGALQHRRRPPGVTKAWADTGYRTRAIDHGADIDGEVTRHDPPRRAPQFRDAGSLSGPSAGSCTTAAWPDYETHPHRCEAVIKAAMVNLMSRRLTRESTSNWVGLLGTTSGGTALGRALPVGRVDHGSLRVAEVEAVAVNPHRDRPRLVVHLEWFVRAQGPGP
ncbi:hypothetical protein OHN19_43540 (plasmid) [Streptomyces griseorubiginosus]|nr:hypothetical protein OHN19_43540 [Streptomyces griseorubiginosus]